METATNPRPCSIRSANLDSTSPLNGEAAELWDKDPALFKTKVLARHKDIEDD
jgi:ubiquitin-protein ligase